MDNKSQKQSRREFLNSIKNGVGIISLGTILAGLAPYDKAFARMSNLYIQNHVDETLKRALNANPTKSTDLAYLQTMNNILHLVEVEKDKTAVNLFNVIKQLVESTDKSYYEDDADGIFELPNQLGNTLVAGYLSATDIMKFGSLGINEIQRKLESAQAIEPAFIQEFSYKVNNAMDYDGNAKDLIANEGRNNLEGIFEQFDTAKSQSRAACAGICTIIGITIVIIIGIIAKNK